MSAKRLHKKRRERERRHRRAERRTERRAHPAASGGGSSPGAPRDAAAAPDAWATHGAPAETIDASLIWHIARTSPGKSTTAFDGLKKAKVTVFRPQTSEVVVRRGRRVIRRAPLMMRTAFIGVTDSDHLDVARDLPGIAEIVSHPEPDPACTGNVPGFVMRPARLDPEMLQGFANRLASGEIVQPVGVTAGDHGIVRAGPFSSFPGVVDELVPCEDPLEPPRLRVSVMIFGRCTPVELGLAEFEVV